MVTRKQILDAIKRVLAARVEIFVTIYNADGTRAERFHSGHFQPGDKK